MVKDNIFFVVRSHAAPGYAKPTFSSSKITEVVFGEFVKVLLKKGSWLKVLQNDGYKSWIKNFYGSFENEDKYFQHMVIDRQALTFGYRLKIIDNNSTNGIYINNEIKNEHELKSGDKIQIGKYSLLLTEVTK